MICIRFIAFVIPASLPRRVTDHYAGKGSMRLSDARRMKARANKRIGEWYLIAGLKRDLKRRA